MSKYALISDIHFGVYAFDIRWMDMQLNYFRGFFKDTLIKQGIKKVYILGDLLDNRKTLSVILESRLKELFQVDLAEFEFVHILGNHDVRYKDTNETHSLGFLEELPNYKLVKDTEVENDILLLPWIHKKTSIVDEFSKYKGMHFKYCFSHLELNGFKLNKGKTMEYGHQEVEDLKGHITIDQVFSGHYHTRSNSNRGGIPIQYCGSPFEFTRIDVGDPKGFIVLDSESGGYEFVKSQNIFHFIKYDFEEDNRDLEYVEQLFKNSFVDIHVSNASLISEEWDLFRKAITDFGMNQLTVVPKIEGVLDLKEELVVKAVSIETALPTYISALEIEDDKKLQLADLLEEIKQDEKLTN